MGMFGNAHTVDPSQAQQDYARLLGPASRYRPPTNWCGTSSCSPTDD
ncbi:hypothetical protein SALBM311S_08277 [Streptomyces alboniger]